MDNEKHNDQHPYQLLRSLDEACRARGLGLPVHHETSEEWQGTAFRLHNVHCVTGLREVAEVLRYPEVSRVPRSREWVRGVANVRGSLLPIIDLNAYLFGRPSLLKRDSRVLVINQNVVAGLMVDEVLGMKYFQETEKGELAGRFEQQIEPYLSGSYRQGGLDWGIFSVGALVQTPQFLHASV